MTQITWTPEMLAQLCTAYKSACAEDKGEFTFGGNEYLTRYAKYLIQYLEEVFK